MADKDIIPINSNFFILKNILNSHCKNTYYFFITQAIVHIFSDFIYMKTFFKGRDRKSTYYNVFPFPMGRICRIKGKNPSKGGSQNQP